MALTDKLTAIGDAIRNRLNITDKLTLTDMAIKISEIGGTIECEHLYNLEGTPIYHKGICHIPMTEAYREGNVGFEKDSISLYCDGTDWHKNSAVTTSNIIDLTDINKITLISRVPQSGTDIPFQSRIALSSSKPSGWRGNVGEEYAEAIGVGNGSSGGTKTVTTELDTSSITGSFYIVADAYSGAQSKAFTTYIDTIYYE